MLRELGDFGLAKTVASAQEQLFIKRIYEQYGFAVRETYLFLGKRQNELFIWADLSKGDHREDISLLLETIRQHGHDIDLIDSPKIQAIVGELRCQYAQCFALDTVDMTTCGVRLHDVYDYIKAYAHGNALADLRRVLHKRFGLELRRILVANEPAVTILCDDQKSYDALLKKRHLIESYGYDEILKKDHHHILTKDDCCVKIVLSTALDKETATFLAREGTAANY